MRVAERAEFRVDRFCHAGLECARDFIPAKLEPRDGVVMTDPADTESEIVQDCLCALDQPEFLVGDFAEVRDARRQTRRRGLIPGRKTCPPREFPDVVFRQARLFEWTADAELSCRLAAGTVVAAI